ncbi:MAG: hypothetical protein M9936_26905 [Caldilinea sp.]|nr:hypothetical protein [Caldilinea sp.]
MTRLTVAVETLASFATSAMAARLPVTFLITGTYSSMNGTNQPAERWAERIWLSALNGKQKRLHCLE